MNIDVSDVFGHPVEVDFFNGNQEDFTKNCFLPLVDSVDLIATEFLNTFIDVKSLPDRFYYMGDRKIDNLDGNPWWIEKIQINSPNIIISYFSDLDRYGIWEVTLEYRNSERYAISEPHFWPKKICRNMA